MWKYDSVHENQIEWYENTLEKLTEENNGVTPKSLAFFHIPPEETKLAYEEYKENGYEDTDDVQYLYGKAGETGQVVYCGQYNHGLIDSMVENGSTQGVFYGHDHVNNFTMLYKGIQLSYSYSVDYLAYTGISKYGLQRGCTIIDIHQDSTFESHLENYYQDKYATTNEKESVSFDNYNDNADTIMGE